MMAYSHRIIVGSPLGDILVQGNETHIQYLKFIQTDHDESESSLLAHWAESCEQQLQQYFSGERSDFDLPIDPQGTEFQQRVWRALCKVDFGTIGSYQQLALAIGNKNLVRAVASANARNPIWLIIPCHRIIGGDLALRGYAGGIVRKAQLLMLEGFVMGCDEVHLANEKTKLILTSAVN